MHRLILFVVSFAMVTLAFAQLGPTIDHTPVATAVADQPIAIHLKTSLSVADVDRIVVAYRMNGAAGFKEAELMAAGDGFSGEIPANSVSVKGVEYFIRMTSKTGTVTTLPPSSGGSPATPFSVTVRVAGSAPSGTVIFQLVSPEPDEPIKADEEVVIAVSVLGGTVDLATVKLELDGVAVTRWSNITPELISYIAKDLSHGRHEIRVSGNTPTGYSIPPLSSGFKAVKASEVDREKSPIVFNGNVWTETRYEKLPSTAPGVDDKAKWWQREQVTFRGRYGKLDFGGRFYATNEERTYEQTKNRYQFWMGMNWWKLGVGDNYPDYTPLTVSGKRVRGLMLELHAPKAHLEIATGYTDQAIASGGRYTYARELTAFRNYYGTKDGSHGGFSIVKVRDDRYSVNLANATAAGVNPKENLVLGTDWQFSFHESRFVLNAEAAMSMYNRNIGPGSISKDDLKNLPGAPESPVDPKDFEKYFVINQNLTPLDPTEKSNQALSAGIQLNYFKNLLRIKYRSTGSQFYAIGSPYVISDDQGISVTDNLRLLNDRLYLTGGYETAKNNLDGNLSTGTVKSGNVTFEAAYYPMESYLPDMSFSIRNGSRKNDITTWTPVASDSSDKRVEEKITTTNIYIAKSFHAMNYNHSASLNISNFNRDDQYTRFHGSPFNATSNMISLNWQTRWRSDFSSTLTYSTMKSGNAVMSGLNYVDKNTTYSTIGLRGDKGWMMSKLTTFGSLSNQSAKGISEFTKMTISAGASYKFAYNINGRMQIDVLQGTDKSSGTSNKFSETFGTLRLEKSF